jgi:hypothetical protein
MMSEQITEANAYALAQAMADQTAFEWFRSDGSGKVEDMNYDTDYDPEEDGDFLDLSFRIVWATQDNYNETHSEYININSAKEFWEDYGFYFKGNNDE